MTSAFFSIRNDCFQRSHEHLRRYVVTTTATTTPGLNDVKRSGHDRQPDGHQQVEPYGHRAVAATTTAASAATTTSSTAAEVTLACQGWTHRRRCQSPQREFRLRGTVNKTVNNNDDKNNNNGKIETSKQISNIHLPFRYNEELVTSVKKTSCWRFSRF